MWHYTSCGLRNIWLRNGFTISHGSTGESVTVEDQSGLHKAIGLYLVINKPKLSGYELRFLRKELDLSQSQLALLLGVSEPSIRGWENTRSKVAPPAEKILRVMYSARVNVLQDVNDLLTHLSQLNRDFATKIEVEFGDSGWQVAA